MRRPQHKPSKKRRVNASRSGVAKALESPTHRQRVIPDKRHKTQSGIKVTEFED